MVYFCTLFDSKYFSRGLAMYESLRDHARDFHLFIFAFDDASLDSLRRLNLPGATIISLSEFEDDELLRVKPTRSKGEYCWTCTSSTILYVLKKYKVPGCTYLDADLYFYDSPEILLREMRDCSVMITSHRHAPEDGYLIKKRGKYCVQFITFKNDEKGLRVLEWWRNACIDWCYARVEDGKFGDQKYLDDWPERFEGVCELEHHGGGIAPWNVPQYSCGDESWRIRVRQKRTGMEWPVIFYHFHSVYMYKDSVELGWYKIAPEVLRMFYVPYLRKLSVIGAYLKETFPDLDLSDRTCRPRDWKDPIRRIYRSLKGIYNIYPMEKLLEQR
jgi:hypothetical protein